MLDSEWVVLLRSLSVASCCVVLLLPAAGAIAWVLARRRGALTSMLEAMVYLPLVMPPVVVGYLLLLVLGRQGFVGGWLESWLGVRIAFTWWAAVIASGVMGFPLMVRSIRQSLEQVDGGYLRAASTLGAGPLRRALTVTWPLAWPGVVTGMVLCFARSLGEFGATVAFAGNIPGRTQTVSTAIYQSMALPGSEGPAWRIAVVSVVVSLVALASAEWLARRRPVDA